MKKYILASFLILAGVLSFILTLPIITHNETTFVLWTDRIDEQTGIRYTGTYNHKNNEINEIISIQFVQMLDFGGGSSVILAMGSPCHAFNRQTGEMVKISDSVYSFEETLIESFQQNFDEQFNLRHDDWIRTYGRGKTEGIISGVAFSLIYLISGIFVGLKKPVEATSESNKRRKIAVILAAVPITGVLGIDRFYRGFIGLGFLKLMPLGLFVYTTITDGGFQEKGILLGIAAFVMLLCWYIGDIVSAASKSSADEMGQRLL